MKDNNNNSKKTSDPGLYSSNVMVSMDTNRSNQFILEDSYGKKCS